MAPAITNSRLGEAVWRAVANFRSPQRGTCNQREEDHGKGIRGHFAVRKRRHPRPSLGTFDRLFWVVARRVWIGGKRSLITVTPETVVRWHWAGIRLYGRLVSRVRRPVGRRQTGKELRDLIWRMVAENPTWGAPRIHGELLMLGFDVFERTVSRCMTRAPRSPDRAKRRLAFLCSGANDFLPCALLLFRHRP